MTMLQVYMPRSRYQHIDGAFFGTTFPHMMFFTYPERLPPQNPPKYVPRIYGFKIHESAIERQKMQLKDRQEGRLRDL
jgi:casein kinase II subunit beta